MVLYRDQSYIRPRGAPRGNKQPYRVRNGFIGSGVVCRVRSVRIGSGAAVWYYIGTGPIYGLEEAHGVGSSLIGPGGML